jgi:hypothetical protein
MERKIKKYHYAVTNSEIVSTILQFGIVLTTVKRTESFSASSTQSKRSFS